jgi:hypothetical protein
MLLLAKVCGASSGFKAWPCHFRPEKGKGRSRARGGKKSMASEYPVYIIDPEKKLLLPVQFEVVMPCFLNGS